LNTTYLTNKCGGEVRNNIGVAALYTFFPWLIIFGVIIAILIVFPGFKSAFSDVLGYYAVANSAKSLFANILIDANLDQKVSQIDDPERRADMMSAAEAITKMLGNKAILINQITPDNFLKTWGLLKPLMKPNITGDIETENQAQLLELIVLKDNIGEAFWYVYTAILISSIVYYNLANRGCVPSVSQIKANYDKYIGKYFSNEIYGAKVEINKDDASTMFVRILSELGIFGFVILFGFLYKNFVPFQNFNSEYYSIWLLNWSILPFIIIRILRFGNYSLLGFFLFVFLWNQIHQNTL
jgi:hypothetical protein